MVAAPPPHPPLTAPLVEVSPGVAARSCCRCRTAGATIRRPAGAVAARPGKPRTARGSARRPARRRRDRSRSRRGDRARAARADRRQSCHRRVRSRRDRGRRGEPKTQRARAGLGLIPTRLAGFGALWRSPIDEAELERRLARVHRPYHAALATGLATLAAAMERRAADRLPLDAAAPPGRSQCRDRRSPWDQRRGLAGRGGGGRRAAARLHRRAQPAVRRGPCARAPWPPRRGHSCASGRGRPRHLLPARLAHAGPGVRPRRDAVRSACQRAWRAAFAALDAAAE
jgi:hypothetical protein